MGPSGSGRGSFVEIGSKTHCYRRVLLCDTCRIPPSSDCSPACIVLHSAGAYATTTCGRPRPELQTYNMVFKLHYIPIAQTHNVCICRDRCHTVAASCQLSLTGIKVLIQREKTENTGNKQMHILSVRSGSNRAARRARVCVREKTLKDTKWEMSLLFTLMLQCSLLRRGRTQGPYHPICCPSVCFSIDFSDKVRIHFSTLLHPLPLLPPSVSFFISFSLSVFLSYIRALTSSLLSSIARRRALESHVCADDTHSAHEDVR